MLRLNERTEREPESNPLNKVPISVVWLAPLFPANIAQPCSFIQLKPPPPNSIIPLTNQGMIRKRPHFQPDGVAVPPSHSFRGQTRPPPLSCRHTPEQTARIGAIPSPSSRSLLITVGGACISLSRFPPSRKSQFTVSDPSRKTCTDRHEIKILRESDQSNWLAALSYLINENNNVLFVCCCCCWCCVFPPPSFSFHRFGYSSSRALKFLWFSVVFSFSLPPSPFLLVLVLLLPPPMFQATPVPSGQKNKT